MEMECCESSSESDFAAESEIASLLHSGIQRWHHRASPSTRHFVGQIARWMFAGGVLLAASVSSAGLMMLRSPSVIAVPRRILLGVHGTRQPSPELVTAGAQHIAAVQDAQGVPPIPRSGLGNMASQGEHGDVANLDVVPARYTEFEAIKKAGDHAKAASKACIALASNGLASVQGEERNAAIFACCGGIAVGSGVLARIAWSPPSDIGMMGAIRREVRTMVESTLGAESVESASDLRHLRSARKIAAESFRLDPDKMHGKLGEVTRDMDVVHNLFVRTVLQDEMLNSSFLRTSFESYETTFNAKHFGDRVQSYFAAGWRRSSVSGVAVPSFLAVRTQTYGLHTLWCGLARNIHDSNMSRSGGSSKLHGTIIGSEAYVREERHCSSERLKALARGIEEDMRQFRSTIREHCILNVRGLHVSELPPSCLSSTGGGEAMEHLPEVHGDVKDLPRNVTHLSFRGNTGLYGRLADLPKSALYLDFHGNMNLKGTLTDLPPNLSHLNFNSNDEIEGDVRELPTSARYLGFRGNTRLKGRLADLPKHAEYIDFHGNRNLQGSLSDLPKSAKHIDLYHNSRIDGNIADLPPSATTIIFNSNNKIGGKLADLPEGAKYLDFSFNEKIHGRLADLPRSLQNILLGHSMNLSGRLADLPRKAVQLRFSFNAQIEGQLSDLPRTARDIDFHASTRIGGSLADLPLSAVEIDFGSNENIDGNLFDLPRSSQYIDFGSNRKIGGELKDLPRGARQVDLFHNTKVQGAQVDLPTGLGLRMRVRPWERQLRASGRRMRLL